MSDDERKPVEFGKAALGCLLIVGLGTCGWGLVMISVAVVAWIVSIFN